LWRLLFHGSSRVGRVLRDRALDCGKIRDAAHGKFFDDDENVSAFVRNGDLERGYFAFGATWLEHTNVAEDFAPQDPKTWIRRYVRGR